MSIVRLICYFLDMDILYTINHSNIYSVSSQEDSEIPKDARYFDVKRVNRIVVSLVYCLSLASDETTCVRLRSFPRSDADSDDSYLDRKTAPLEATGQDGVNEDGESSCGARARKAIMMDNLRLVPHVRSANGGRKTREVKEQKGRKTAAKKSTGRRRKHIAGWDTSRVFRSIPPFRLALRSVSVDTPRTPVFPPLWVRTLLSARPAEARPNPSTSSVHSCISSGGRGREMDTGERGERRPGGRREG